MVHLSPLPLPHTRTHPLEFLHVKPGKGAAFVRSKLKNCLNGTTVEKTFRAGEQLPVADMIRRDAQYTYEDAGQVGVGDIYWHWGAQRLILYWGASSVFRGDASCEHKNIFPEERAVLTSTKLCAFAVCVHGPGQL